jgi:perosamine synthetase
MKKRESDRVGWIMIPRKRLDIGWADLLCGAWSCIRPGRRDVVQRRVESAWSGRGEEGRALACLSVRSGFDALLGVLALPAGSEVLLSAVTIRDMVRIVEAHGLVPVPVEIDPRTLAVCPEALTRAVSANSRALVVAHLFGSRMPLEPVLRIARAHGLLVIEDCAQAYTGSDGDDDRGHPESDVSLFSFGPIKTATALAGGLLTFRDRALRDRTAAAQAAWPVQPRSRFLTRVGKYSVLKLLSYRSVFTLFAAACRLLGKSHDEIISGSVRGFAGDGFFTKIRHRPSLPLLALLECRLRTFDRARITARTAQAAEAILLLPPLERPGDAAERHSYWVLPVCCDDPDRLIRFLWTRGFDATRGASSLCVVQAPAERPETDPAGSRRMFERLLYLPLHEGMNGRDVERLARAVSAGLEV